MASHLWQESDAQVGIYHLNQRKQATGREATDFFTVADFACGESVVSEAVPVLEQQNTFFIQPAKAIVVRRHML